MDGPEQDEDLIRRLAAGETAALEALYDEHADVVFALIVRIVADRRVAEDLLQETFLRAWQRAGTYRRARGRVRSWLFGIAHHLALNEQRRRARRPREGRGQQPDAERELAALPGPGPDPWEAAWTAVRRADLAKALDQLPPAQRAVIELYAAGHTQADIAARLGEPLGTVKTRMRRGLLRLRDILQAQGLDLG